MDLLTSVTEILILAGAGWVILQALTESSEVAPQEELIPVPVKEKGHPLQG